MEKVAIITVINDNYDSLKPVLSQTGVEVEWILVTDSVPGEPLGWNVIHEPVVGHPNTSSKPPKTSPWRYTDAEHSIYIDASYRITSPTFAIEAISLLSEASPIAQFVHPWRDCCYDEATYSATLPKYAGEPLMAMAEAYRIRGHPSHWGLWASGCIIRIHTPAVLQFGAWWQGEIEEWSYQCQVSEPPCLRSAGLRPIGLPGTHFANPWMQYEASGRH